MVGEGCRAVATFHTFSTGFTMEKIAEPPAIQKKYGLLPEPIGFFHFCDELGAQGSLPPLERNEPNLGQGTTCKPARKGKSSEFVLVHEIKGLERRSC